MLFRSENFSIREMASINFAEILTIKGNQELKTVLGVAKKNLAAHQNKTAQVNKVLSHLQTAVKEVSIGFDIYAKYRKSEGELEAREQIEQTKKEAEKIEQHKLKVYDVMVPLLENILNSVNRFQG